jgi:transaldolase
MKKKNKIKIYADGSNFQEMINLNQDNKIKGFTTNPSLMKKEGVKNYEKFAKEILKKIKSKPISFEVFSDNLDKMELEALKISKWGKNVFVKIPITNSKGKSTAKLIDKLNSLGINCNITAIFTISQVKHLIKNVNFKSKNIFSIFAGRIADTGKDPKKIILETIKLTRRIKKIESLWASVREPFNLIQAENYGCQIITVTPDIIKKTNKFNYSLSQYSIDTVKQFYIDAKKSKFKLI